VLELRKLAHRANVDAAGSFAELNTLPAHSEHMSVPMDIVNDGIERIGRTDQGLGALFSRITLATLTSHEDQLPELIRTIFKQSLLDTLTDACAWILKIDRSLSYRFSMPRIFLSVEQNPSMFNRAAERWY
jgi:hypothetical protein